MPDEKDIEKKGDVNISAPLTRAQRRQAERAQMKESTEKYLKGQMGANYVAPRYVPYFRNNRGLQAKIKAQNHAMSEQLRKEGKTEEEIKQALEKFYNTAALKQQKNEK